MQEGRRLKELKKSEVPDFHYPSIWKFFLRFSLLFRMQASEKQQSQLSEGQYPEKRLYCMSEAGKRPLKGRLQKHPRLSIFRRPI